MARLWHSGFELNTLTANVEFTSTSGSPTIGTTHPRSGTYAGQITSLTSGTPKYFSYQFAAANVSTDIKVRTYIFITAYPNASTTIGAFFDSSGNNSSGLTLSTAGVITMKDNNGTLQATSGTLALNTWYRLEHRQFNSSTTLELLVNGVSQGSSTSAGTAVYDNYHWGGNINASETATTIGIYFDDLAINDASGTAQTGYPGAGSLGIGRPNGTGDSNGFATAVGGTAGAANNYTRVNEVTPDNATTYNASNTAAASDLFTTGSPGMTAGSTVNCVTVGAVLANITAADTTTALQLQCEQMSGGTIATSAAIAIDTLTWSTNSKAVPHTYPLVLYVDPTGTPWSITTISTMQIGYKLSTAHTDPIGVTAVWAYVDYNPGTPVNLLSNPSFETAAVWIGGGTTGNITFPDTDITAQDLSAELKIIQATGGSGTGYVYQDVTVLPNVQYTLSAYVDITGWTAGGLFLKADSTSFTAYSTASSTSANQSWTRISTTFTTGAGVTTIRTVLDSFGSAVLTGYWDAVMLNMGPLSAYVGSLPIGKDMSNGNNTFGASISQAVNRAGTY